LFESFFCSESEENASLRPFPKAFAAEPISFPASLAALPTSFPASPTAFPAFSNPSLLFSAAFSVFLAVSFAAAFVSEAAFLVSAAALFADFSTFCSVSDFQFEKTGKDEIIRTDARIKIVFFINAPEKLRIKICSVIIAQKKTDMLDNSEKPSRQRQYMLACYMRFTPSCLPYWKKVLNLTYYENCQRK
jgi:hypothetical protein